MMIILRNLRIKFRLWLLTILALVGVIIITLISLIMFNRTLLQEKEFQVRKLVESAYSIIEDYHGRFLKGEFDETAAKTAALNTIRSMRFDNGNYFWVNDMTAKMIMHPIKPALENKDLSDFKDPAGKKLFSVMVDTVKKNGEGIVPYLWPKPGSEKPVAKVSYVKGFTPWGWVVGSGIYIDDVEVAFQEKLLILVLVVAVILGLFIILSYIITKSIIFPIQKTTLAMNDISQGGGDLTARLDSDGNDEVTELAEAFNRYTSKIHKIICQVKDASDVLSKSSSELLGFSDQTNNDMMRQRSETQQVSTAVTEMSATIKDIAESSRSASQSANDAEKESINGETVVTEAVESINNLASEVDKSANVVNRLESESEAIGSVLDVIRGIAEQTNLLALNAAIEAARAGEQGRGFAVVADEVRTLASRTQESTQEIQQMIENLQSGSSEAVKVMQNSRDTTQLTVEKAEEAAQSLKKIASSIVIISEMNRKIAQAADEQSIVATEIDRSIVQISDLADQGTDNTTKVSSASEKLSSLSGELEKLVYQFKV
jgi:methyl-accepting chemotaxis protein